ncbi:MAG: DUF4212 domain-containing protein [Planctomycetota bacterium]
MSDSPSPPQGSPAPDNPPPPPPDPATQAKIDASVDRYWAANLRIMAVLLAIWAVVSLGCGILFADALNAFRIGGFPLGFWFAQQGSIATFIVLILVYAILLNRLDAKHRDELHALRSNASAASPDTPAEPAP